MALQSHIDTPLNNNPVQEIENIIYEQCNSLQADISP
jgi:hypothetical protein